MIRSDTNPLRRFYMMAWRRCLSGHYPVRHKRMYALLIKGGSVLGGASNSPARMPNPPIHAEVRALRPHRDYSGSSIIVARANGRISRPCQLCIPYILAAGCREMVYINGIGNLTREILY